LAVATKRGKVNIPTVVLGAVAAGARCPGAVSATTLLASWSARSKALSAFPGPRTLLIPAEGGPRVVPAASPSTVATMCIAFGLASSAIDLLVAAIKNLISWKCTSLGVWSRT